MPVNIQEVIDALAHVCAEKNLKCCITESLKGGLLTGASAVVGGLLLGPVGFLIGGVVGGGACSVSAAKKFKPVSVVLNEMTIQQKKQLYEKIKHAFRNIGVQDFTAIAMLILSTAKFQDIALETVRDFLSNECSYKIAN